MGKVGNQSMSTNFKQIHLYNDLLGELTVVYRRTKSLTKQITNSKDAYKFIFPYFDEYLDNHEEFMIIHLNNSGYVSNVQVLAKGSDTACVVSVRLIMQEVLLLQSNKIIAVHNHPSGSLKPSKEDIQITKNIKKAVDYFGVRLMDHLILTRESYFSFLDNGIL